MVRQRPRRTYVAPLVARVLGGAEPTRLHRREELIERRVVCARLLGESQLLGVGHVGADLPRYPHTPPHARLAEERGDGHGGAHGSQARTGWTHWRCPRQASHQRSRTQRQTRTQ